MKEFRVTVLPLPKRPGTTVAKSEEPVTPLILKMREIRADSASRKLYLDALAEDCANAGHLGPVLTKDKIEAMNRLKRTLVGILRTNRLKYALERGGLFGISMEARKEEGAYIKYQLGDEVLVDKPQSLGVPKKVLDAMDTGVQITAVVIEARKRQ